MIKTVYFATNRQPLLDPADPAHKKIIGFSSELGPTSGIDVRYGSAKVKVNLARKTYVYDPASLVVAEQKLVFAEGESPVLGSDTIFETRPLRCRDVADSAARSPISAVSAAGSVSLSCANNTPRLGIISV